LKKIVRLRDAYSVAEVTTAATTIEHSTIIGPDDTISASGRSDLTLTPKSKDIVASEDQIFPDTFLVLDRCIKHQGICIPGLKPHDNKLCWCAVLEELQPSKADFWTHYYLGDDFDVNIRDSFQNSVLHLLAARGSSWDTILEVISLGADVNAKNIARQNFLQVADCTIFEELEKQASNGRIGTILDVLETSGFEFYHSDYFGRSFFHMIYKRLQRQSVALHSMEALGIKLPITRDAFGCIVSERKRKQVGAGDVLQLTGLLTPESYLSSPPTPQPSIWPFGTSRSSVKEAPSLSTQSSDSMGTTRNGISIANSKSRPAIPGTNLTDADLWKNARLIETARLASCATWIEETEGRNGLQCLAEAVLDIHIENDKVIKSNTSSMKRKRCQQDISPGSQRLQLRYQLVKDLVARGVDVNNYDNRGSTVLMAFITHLADGEDDKVLAKILTHLIRHGANIHWRNRQGDSALHVAIRLGRKVATRVLLDHGANVHARNAEGKGVLSVGQSHYFAARDEPSLYAAIMVCMALAIDYGAVAAPSIVQEWSTNTVVD
jgi:ankyrin repeat protein